MSSISLSLCNYEQYKFDDQMFLIYYIFDGEKSETPDECPTPIDVYLNLEMAFFGGKADKDQSDWLFEIQIWCENAKVGDVFCDDDDFIIERVK